MDAAVEARLLGNDPIVAAQKIVPYIDIPRQTLCDRVKAGKKQREAAANGSGGKDDILELPLVTRNLGEGLRHSHHNDSVTNFNVSYVLETI